MDDLAVAPGFHKPTATSMAMMPSAPPTHIKGWIPDGDRLRRRALRLRRPDLNRAARLLAFLLTPVPFYTYHTSQGLTTFTRMVRLASGVPGSSERTNTMRINSPVAPSWTSGS